MLLKPPLLVLMLPHPTCKGGAWGNDDVQLRLADCTAPRLLLPCTKEYRCEHSCTSSCSIMLHSGNVPPCADEFAAPTAAATSAAATGGRLPSNDLLVLMD